MSSVHDVFHVSMLRRYTPDPAHVVDWGEIEVDTDDTMTRCGPPIPYCLGMKVCGLVV